MLLKDRRQPPAVKRVFRLFVLALVCACVVLSGCGRAITPSAENQVEESETADTGGGADTRDAPETPGEGETAQTPDEGENPPAQTPDEGENPPAEQPRASLGIFGILFFAVSVANFLLFLSLRRKISKVEISLKRQQSAFKPLAPTDVSLKQDGFSPPPEGQNSYQAAREKESTPPPGYDTRTGNGTQAPAESASPAAQTRLNESPPAQTRPTRKYFKVSFTRGSSILLEESQSSGDLIGEADANNPAIYSLVPFMQNVNGRRGAVSESMLFTGSLRHCFVIESQGDFYKPGRWISVEAPARAEWDGNRLRLTRRGKLRVTGHY